MKQIVLVLVSCLLAINAGAQRHHGGGNWGYSSGCASPIYGAVMYGAGYGYGYASIGWPSYYYGPTVQVIERQQYVQQPQQTVVYIQQPQVQQPAVATPPVNEKMWDISVSQVDIDFLNSLAVPGAIVTRSNTKHKVIFDSEYDLGEKKLTLRTYTFDSKGDPSGGRIMHFYQYQGKWCADRNEVYDFNPVSAMIKKCAAICAKK